MEIELKEIQRVLLEMLKVLHNFCEDKNINYYMIGGTCLGARRHNGFIPWDDDMDIGIPRKDYNRLCEFSKAEIPSGYEFRYYKTDNQCPIHYVKMIKTDTTLIENGYRNYVEGIYIDIFPLDGVKSNTFLEKLRWNKIWFLQAIVINYSTTTLKKKKWKRIFKWWCEHQNIEKIHNKLEKLMTLYSYEESDTVCNFLGAYREREIYDKKIFGTPKKYKFEQYEFYGPECIDKYLKKTYGDFMKLPSMEERKGKHNYYYVNLKLPYKLYKVESEKDQNDKKERKC